MTENTENGDATKPTGPIEVWIRQKKLTGFTCMVVCPVETSRIFEPGEPRRGKPLPRRRILNTSREW
jgi:hypothetical protein